mgnify:CR=1 FL=1
MSEGLTLSSTSIRLRKGHLLPGKAKMIAEIVWDNEPVTRPELESTIEDHDSLEKGDIRDNVRLLRMSDNLYIEDGEAFIDPVRCGENGVHVMEKFRRWKYS